MSECRHLPAEPERARPPAGAAGPRRNAQDEDGLAEGRQASQVWAFEPQPQSGGLPEELENSAESQGRLDVRTIVFPPNCAWRSSGYEQAL